MGPSNPDHPDHPKQKAARALDNFGRSEYERGYNKALGELESVLGQLTASPAMPQAQHRALVEKRLAAARAWLANGGGW